MRTGLISLILILGLSVAYGRTLDEIIRDAYENGTHSYADNTVLVDMDMRYSREEYEEMISGKDSRKMIRGDQYRWPHGEVPYTISSAFSSSETSLIKAAMDEWEQYTCIRWIPRSVQHSYLHIQDDGSGCNAHVGMKWGKQVMNLASGKCFTHPVIVHQLGHTIGFVHEHQRPDRDDYIQINWGNIGSEWKKGFEIFSQSDVDSRGIGYDYFSIMHYGKTAYSGNGGVTLSTYDSKYRDRIGTSPGLQFSDIMLANSIYECDSRCISKPQCAKGGFVGKDCKCWCDSGDWFRPVCDCGNSRCSGNRIIPTCLDDHRECKDWATRGDCQPISSRCKMRIECELACSMCGYADCPDFHYYCYNEYKGHCNPGDIQYEWMTQYCCKECKYC